MYSSRQFMKHRDTKLSYIRKMGVGDMVNFFTNTSNLDRIHMEFYMHQGYDVVTHADVISTHDKHPFVGYDAFSMVLLAYRYNKIMRKQILSWGSPDGMFWLINLCITDRKAFESKNRYKDFVAVNFTTIVPSISDNDEYKLREVPCYRFVNYEAVAIYKLFETFGIEGDCFYNIQ